MRRGEQNLVADFLGQVCWKCKATKGQDDVQYCYTNMSLGAPWRATFYSEDPWDEQPGLAQTIGFNIRMIQIDCLHAWHLGTGRDLCGGAIKYLVKRPGFFSGRTQDARLAHASERLKEFCKQRGLRPSLRKLTKANVSWGGWYPELRCKGFDTYLVLLWLVDEILSRDAGHDDLSTVPCFHVTWVQ